MLDGSAQRTHVELYERLRPFIAERVRRADVDDVLQEVLIRLHHGLPHLRQEERFGPWVYQVTRSAIADHYRRSHRQRWLGPSAADADELAAPDDEPSEAVAAELARYIAAFVAALPSPYREALTLTELEGMTQRQAAEMLGISLSGMKSRVQRGRAQLRELLDACCEIALDARGAVVSCERRPGGAKPAGCCRGEDGGSEHD